MHSELSDVNSTFYLGANVLGVTGPIIIESYCIHVVKQPFVLVLGIFSHMSFQIEPCALREVHVPI